MARLAIAAYRAVLRLVVALGFVAWVAAPASAQTVRAQIGACVLEAGPGAERALESLAREAREIMPRLEEDLGVRFAAPFRMVLIPRHARGGHGDLMVLRLDAGVPAWAAGYVVPAARLGAIRLALASSYPYGTPASVLAHEATHMLLHDAASDTLPLWFQEGVATYEGRRWSLSDLLIHATSVLTEDSPTLAELDEWFRASEPHAREAYATSFSFVSWTVSRHGRSVLRHVLAEARARPFPEAWAAATGATLEAEEAAWRGQTKTRYRWVGIITASATFWIVVSLLAAAAGIWRRLRAKRARARWAEEEGEEGQQVTGPLEDAGPEDGPGAPGPRGA